VRVTEHYVCKNIQTEGTLWRGVEPIDTFTWADTKAVEFVTFETDEIYSIEYKWRDSEGNLLWEDSKWPGNWGSEVKIVWSYSKLKFRKSIFHPEITPGRYTVEIWINDKLRAVDNFKVIYTLEGAIIHGIASEEILSDNVKETNTGKLRIRNIEKSENRILINLNEDVVGFKKNAYKEKLSAGAKRKFKEHVASFIKNLFENYTGLEKVEVRFWVPIFIDKYGNTEDKIAGAVYMDRETFEKINWEKITQSMVIELFKENWELEEEDIFDLYEKMKKQFSSLNKGV